MKFISLSQYPGRTGEYFYNNLFKEYNIDATYEARACTDIAESLHTAVKEGVQGISVSMPFKQTVIPFLNSRHANVELYNSCNTVTVKDGVTRGYNCDLAGVEHVTKSILRSEKINILGSGAIAGQFTTYLEGAGYYNLNLYSRATNNWPSRFAASDIIINATAMGTVNEESPYSMGQLNPGTRLVIDLAIKDNDLKKQCQNLGIKYISGREFYKHQFYEQFRVYTGVKVDSTLYETLEKQQYESV